MEFEAAHLGCHLARLCLPLNSHVLAFHRPCHSTEGRGSRGKVYRVDKHWESVIKVSLKQCRAYYDDASGCTCACVDSRHYSYQHTEVGYNLSHKVDVEVPIRLRISLLPSSFYRLETHRKEPQSQNHETPCPRSYGPQPLKC